MVFSFGEKDEMRMLRISARGKVRIAGKREWMKKVGWEEEESGGTGIPWQTQQNSNFQFIRHYQKSMGHIDYIIRKYLHSSLKSN